MQLHFSSYVQIIDRLGNVKRLLFDMFAVTHQVLVPQTRSAEAAVDENGPPKEEQLTIEAENNTTSDMTVGEANVDQQEVEYKEIRCIN